ncbi:2891_t:CDS:2, partial [Gigaspora margarita]
SSSTTSLDNIICLDGDQPKPKVVRFSRDNFKWNPTWKITYTWLHLAKLNNNLITGCEYLKEQLIKQYIKTKDHQKLIKIQDKLQISLEIGFINQLETTKIIDLISLTKYYIKCNSSEEYNLVKIYILNYLLFESLKEESHANYRNYSNKHAAQEFIDAIEKLLKRLFAKRFRSLLFGVKIQIDMVIQKITSDFLGTDNQEPTWRNYLYQFMYEKDLLTSDILLYIEQFAQVTIENLQACFPDCEITNAFYIFDPCNLIGTISLTEYGNKEIAFIANFYSTKVYYTLFIESDNLIQE